MNGKGTVTVSLPANVKIIHQQEKDIPKHFSLSQNYPNPFNPATRIQYELPQDAHVSLKVFNTLGQEVVTLVNDEKIAGGYNVEFNASDLPSGIYLYRFIAGDFVQIRKMAVVK